MIVEKNKVVKFHYRLSEPGLDVLENSYHTEPMLYLHGHNNMLKGVEKSMEGKQVGDTFSVTLPPEETYGPVVEDAKQRVSIKHVIKKSKAKIKYKPGMLIQINTSEGSRDVVVVKAGLKTLDVDTNHPLAGKTLNFEIEIIDVRDALPEEVSHGHVHGEGGHHH